MGSDTSKVVDPWLLDSCKLAWHPGWLDKWFCGKPTYPIYVEIGLTNNCQHRCLFCSFDFTGYKNIKLKTSVIQQSLRDMAKAGVKAIMFAGEGEPFLHPQIVEIADCAKRAGLDISITTNGHSATSDKLYQILPLLSWIKFSINGGTCISHAKLHGTSEESFDKVMENLEYAAKHKGTCTVGVQSVILPEHEQNIVELAWKVKSMGVDYYTIKPFTGHPLRELNQSPHYSRQEELFEKLDKLSMKDFHIIIRQQAFQNLQHNRDYTQCYGIDAMTYIAATGDVYACSNFLGKQEYSYGNINKQAFKEIWWGERRQAVRERIQRTKLADCRLICRLDPINQYLWKMKNPPGHINFI